MKKASVVANIDEFTSEKRCVYKDRIYFVRDNGAVYRQQYIISIHEKQGSFFYERMKSMGQE